MKGILKILVILLTISILLSAGYVAWRLLFLLMQQNRQTQEIQSVFYQNTGFASSGSEDPFSLSAIQQINPDLIGWIHFPDLSIDYPIAQTVDNEYYLTHDYKKEKSSYGTIFLDYRCTWDSRNRILHGHNMRDGSMFAPLLDLTEPQVLKKNSRFWTYSSQGKVQWEIFSVFKINPEVDSWDYLQTDFVGEEGFQKYIKEVMEHSLIQTGRTAHSSDQLLTLSTCSEWENRTVVVAKKV